MKSLLIAATAAGALLCAAPALAQQNFTNPTYYGTLGYNDFSGSGADLSAITGRIGARVTPHIGVEGEVSVGIGSDHANVAGAPVGVHLNDQYAGYAVGYLPVLPNADLFARVGYGHIDLHTRVEGLAADTGADSVNYGAGGQYFFDHANGVRAEYTRQDYQCSSCGGADVWSVAYVRKF